MSKVTKKAKVASNEDASLVCDWDLLHVLEDRCQWDRWALKNTVELLDDDNTVPFIARYRKERTCNMDAEKIRQVKEELDNLRAVQSKISTVYKAVDKLGKVTQEWKHVLAAAQTMSEVDHLYAPFKPGSKRTLAERARELGLEPVALNILKEPWIVNLQSVVKSNVEGLSSFEEVEKGIQHILADIISKHKDVMEAVRECCKTSNVQLTSKKMNSKDADQKDIQKFELYNDFKASIRHIKPHQVLAINRGVSKKLLSMKIMIPDSVERRVQYLGQQIFTHPRANDYIRKLVKTSIQDAYSRLIEPLMVRHFKSELTKTAEEASVEVFASNLKRLLLTPPVRGKVILGVDPGFKHGCKYSVISVTGQVLDTGVFYPHTSGNHSNVHQQVEKIRNTVLKFRCDTVAIGNGTACRETETFFSEHIKRGTFSPVQVKFCIVNEAGASIYSASPEAIKELPDMDVSLRGAVSIARRLQDPMAELVKIEHKHLGVGMYQHDIAENRLKTSLDGVVEDCVSFVGVDINVASETLLKHIAGLTSATAKKIISHREEKGPFINRDHLTTIKGLGPKTYKQCAGFVRVLPQTRGASGKSEDSKKDEPTTTTGTKKRKAPAKARTTAAKKAKLEMSQDPNPLDMTSIHPESYDIANRLLEIAGIPVSNVGTPMCNTATKNFIRSKSLESLAKELDVGVPTLTLITDALQQPIGHDIREEFEKPLFKEGVKQFSDLKAGDKLSGRVTNMVHFGAFVDVGVGRDGLIHSSQMRPNCMGGKKTLELGDKVNVTVQSIDVNRKRLGLILTELVS